MRTLFLISGFAALLALGGCSDVLSPFSGDKTYANLVKDESIKNLVSMTRGSVDANIVIIYAQGGPILEPDTYFSAQIDKAIETDAFIVVTHQAQTQSPQIFQTEAITFEQAKQYDLQSAHNLEQVTRHYVDQGKTVYVVGVSFGAFMLSKPVNAALFDHDDGADLVWSRPKSK